jgi:hypothetical protein
MRRAMTGMRMRVFAAPFLRVAILLLACSRTDLTRASWQFEQVNSPGDHSGWTTQIATDSAGTPVVLAQQTDGDTHIHKLLSNGVEQHSILPEGTFFSDIAVSADREVIGIARIGAPKLFGQDVGQRRLELIESTPAGNWQTRIVEHDLGINSGAVALAYGPDGQPMIAYVRAATQSLELATRQSDGAWQNSTVATGSYFAVPNAVDLAVAPDGTPHVFYNDHSITYGTQHSWYSPIGWQSEPISSSSWVTKGASFDITGKLFVPTRTPFVSNSPAVTFVRNDDGWTTLNASTIPEISAAPDLAFDAAGRPHIAAATRSLIRHRWWNGAAWRQEMISWWSSNVQGPESVALSIDGDNNLNVAYNNTKSGVTNGGDLFYAHTIGTPLGTPFSVTATYDLQADGVEDGSWTLTDGGRQILVGPTLDGERRMLLSFDLSTLPAGAQIIGAELDFQQRSGVSSSLEPPVRALVYAFADDGTPDAADADLHPGTFQVGFLDPISGSGSKEDVVVTRLQPQIIAGAAAEPGSHLGLLVAPYGLSATDPIYATDESQAPGGFPYAPRLWLYLRQPGDFNADGTVDSADYIVWRSSSGQSGVNLPADANSDGHVDSLDYQAWRANFGNSLGSGLNTSPTFPFGIPEPSTTVMALTTFIAAVTHRRRRQSPRNNIMQVHKPDAPARDIYATASS